MAHKHKRARESVNFGFATGGGILAGILSGAVLIFCLAAIAYRMNDPSASLLPLGLIALAVSALITGRVSCAMWGNRSLIPTLTAGVIYALLITAAGLCLPGNTLAVWLRCLGCPVIALLALVGGLIGRRGERKRHRR